MDRTKLATTTSHRAIMAPATLGMRLGRIEPGRAHIEKMGTTTATGRNHISLLFTAGSGWIVPSSSNERRFVIYKTASVGKSEDAARSYLAGLRRAAQ